MEVFVLAKFDELFRCEKIFSFDCYNHLYSNEPKIAEKVGHMDCLTINISIEFSVMMLLGKFRLGVPLSGQ